MTDFNKHCTGGVFDGPNEFPYVMANDPIWEYDSLLAIRKMINDAGLEWYVMENFNSADWSDILLDGPKK